MKLKYLSHDQEHSFIHSFIHAFISIHQTAIAWLKTRRRSRIAIRQVGELQCQQTMPFGGHLSLCTNTKVMERDPTMHTNALQLFHYPVNETVWSLLLRPIAEWPDFMLRQWIDSVDGQRLMSKSLTWPSPLSSQVLRLYQLNCFLPITVQSSCYLCGPSQS